MISRQTVLEAVEKLSANQTEISLLELSDLFDVRYNTVRGHFSNGRFPEQGRASRAKRVYDLSTAKAYALWLYMSKDSECILNFPAIRRDQLLADPGVDALWDAFKKSDSDLIGIVSA